MKDYPLVSINIRTYNSAKTLDETLQSIKKQSYPNIEILIADGYSKDKTVEIAKAHKVIVFYAQRLGEARQKNYEQSRGEFIFSVDSDQVLDKNLVKECFEMCKRGYDAVTIAERSIIGKGTFVERVIAYDRWLIDKTRSTDPIFGTACPRFFKKSVLKTLDWLNPLSIFDDTILYTQLVMRGAKVGYLSSSGIKHHEVTTLGQVFKKFYRYGHGYVQALHKQPLAVTTHSLPRTAYFSSAAFSNPFYLLGLFLLYFVKASAAGAGMISSLIK